ncbi:MAG: hypothetical protein AAFP19_24375, partial [Bacteroidota bacterium]
MLQAKELGGDYVPPQRPVFWPKKWLSGKYQTTYNEFVRYHHSQSPFFVRLNTYLSTAIFDHIPHENILQGKEGHLFTQSDCEAMLGLALRSLIFLLATSVPTKSK